MGDGSFGFFANNNLTESHLAMLSVRSKRQVTTTTASTSATTTAVTTTILTTTTTTITTTTTYSMAAHETMREVTCVNWHSAADNYWKWDQEVPEHCYRKYPNSQKCRFCSLLKRSHNTFSSVVNCTLSELPDIDTDRTDVHRVGWNNELTYQTTVK